MASGPRITSRELMLKTVAEGSVKRKKEPDRDQRVAFYYFPNNILGNLKEPIVVDLLNGKILEIGTSASALKKNKESKTVVEKPVMVRDLAYPVRHEICQMLNVIRTLGGDFKTLAGSLGMTTQEIRLISDQNDPADEVLMWWETQNSAIVQNLRLQLKDMRRDDVVELLEEDQKLAQVCYKSCSDQIRGEILRLNCVSLSCPENTGDEKILAILFEESLEGIGWNFEDSTEFPDPRNSEVYCVAETNDNQESIVTGNCFASVAFAVLIGISSSCNWLFFNWMFSSSCNCQ